MFKNDLEVRKVRRKESWEKIDKKNEELILNNVPQQLLILHRWGLLSRTKDTTIKFLPYNTSTLPLPEKLHIFSREKIQSNIVNTLNKINKRSNRFWYTFDDLRNQLPFNLIQNYCSTKKIQKLQLLLINIIQGSYLIRPTLMNFFHRMTFSMVFWVFH